MKRVDIIIPCYNEEEVLPHLFQRLDELKLRVQEELFFIFVNDGSRDTTWSILEEHCQEPSDAAAINLSRNFGHQVAVSAGLFHSTGEAAVIIDADLQDPPEVIMEMIEEWHNGNDVVYAVRKSRKDNLIKVILAWGFYRVLDALSDIKIPRDCGDFALLDARVVKIYNLLPERNRYLRGIRAWMGFRQVAVEFDRDERAAGEPQYTTRKSFALAMDGIVSFSTKPLRIASWCGIYVSIFAVLGTVFTLLQKAFSEQFAKIGLEPGPGFPTIVISVLFLGGVQLCCLGIVGEYLGRIYDEVKGRPQWLIRERINIEPAGEHESVS